MTKIGILEQKDDPFINDVISHLHRYEIEFLSFREQLVPMKSDYRVVVDRYSYDDLFLREMVKSLSLEGTYIINNPFLSTAINKILDIKHFESLGIPHPKTIVLPKLDRDDDSTDIVIEPDWDRILENIKFPCILKPYNGYAWDEVHRIETIDDLKEHYECRKYDYLLMVQELVEFIDYYRVFCINKRNVLISKWNPKPFDMGEYIYTDLKQIDDLRDRIEELTIKLNKILDLDMNAVEWCITEGRKAIVIEAYNDVPDINPEKIPEPYYKWLVEKFSNCIEEKFNSEERNRTIFNP